MTGKTLFWGRRSYATLRCEIACLFPSTTRFFLQKIKSVVMGIELLQNKVEMFFVFYSAEK